MWYIISSVFLGWGLGANDSANIFGTGVSTRLIKYSAAIILTAIFVIIGAILEGSKCMDTVGGLIGLNMQTALIATVSAGIIVVLLTWKSLPISTSQAIIGAITGIGLYSGSNQFNNLGKIVICWATAPIAAIIASYILYRVLGFLAERYLKKSYTRDFLIRMLFILTGCYEAYALGANNVANTTGVYVGVGLITPLQGALWGGGAIALGALTSSRKVMLTVGERIVPLDPFSALISQLSAGAILHTFTQLAVPVSASQAIVGAIIGVGFVKGVKTVSLKMVRNILLGWFATPIFAGIISFLFIYLVNYLLK
jgi:PiT family inorganic phosphate transporter